MKIHNRMAQDSSVSLPLVALLSTLPSQMLNHVHTSFTGREDRERCYCSQRSNTRSTSVCILDSRVIAAPDGFSRPLPAITASLAAGPVLHPVDMMIAGADGDATASPARARPCRQHTSTSLLPWDRSLRTGKHESLRVDGVLVFGVTACVTISCSTEIMRSLWREVRPRPSRHTPMTHRGAPPGRVHARDG